MNETAAGEKIATRDEDLFERNMAAFEKRYYPIFAALDGIGETHSELVFEDDGDPDVEFRGTRLYGGGAKRFTEKQLADYCSLPFRLKFVPPQNETLDHVAAEFNYRILRRGVDAGMEFAMIPVGTESFFLIVYGVGLGFHIEPLVEITNCKGLILIEPNLEFLYHSLFVFDWESLLERFRRDEHRVFINIENHYKKISHDIRNYVRGTCPSFFDGTQIYTHYRSSVMEMAQGELEKDCNLYLSGLGFMEDELLMIENSYKNLKDYDSYIYQRDAKIRALPAFVVGSGPSIDGCLDVIRENQDRAIIVSCGTALGVLLANGIVPDFQIEMENVDLVYDLLSDKTERYDLKDLCLVASTTVDPRITELFQRKVLYFRQALSSWEIFAQGPTSGLCEVGPTVTNAGLSFAQEIGCREFYFFGMDYGSTHTERHHSEDSDYRPGGKAPNTNTFTQQRVGNFGGIIYTHGVFIWARAAVEQSIRRFRRGRSYFNCSDGMAIDGAVPKVARAVSPPADVDKVAEIGSILDELPKYSREQFDQAWSAADWGAEVAELCDHLAELCDFEDEDGDYRIRFMAKIAAALIPRDRDPGVDILVIRGSVLMIMISAAYYLSRVNDPEKIPEMEMIIREEMKRIYEMMKEEALEFFQSLEDESGPLKKNSD